MKRRFNCVSGKAEEARRSADQSTEPKWTEPEPQQPDRPQPEPERIKLPRTNWLRQKRSRRDNRCETAWRDRESDHSESL